LTISKKRNSTKRSTSLGGLRETTTFANRSRNGQGKAHDGNSRSGRSSIGGDDVMITPYYNVDGIQIYLGDCREILPHLPKVDLVLTDPPYGIKENAHRIASRTKAAATIDYGDFEWDREPASKEEIEIILNAGKKAIIWGGNYFYLTPSRGWLVWDKLNSGNFADCELAWTNLPMSVRIFRHRWNGMIRASENDIKRVHPTQKPIQLMEWCIKWAEDAQIVLDPMMGSGTTLVAAKQLGRKAIGIEIEQRYCDIAIKRLSQGVLNLSIESNSKVALNREKPFPSLDDKNHTEPQGLFDGEHRRDIENI
jgi:DNA modification methylase